MSEPGDRRFTDREVALILRDAVALDAEGGGEGVGGRGLFLADLRGIAAEVGISSASVERAASRVDRRGEPGGLSGAPLVHQAVRVVPREMDQTGLARLIRLVDDRASGAGTVSEALGGVRWTSEDRFASTRVSVTPEAGGTAIRVVEKVPPRARRIMHAIPAVWAVGLSGPLIGALDPGPALLAGLVAGAAAIGVGAGRLVWNWTARRRHRRVRELAEELAGAASTGG